MSGNSHESVQPGRKMSSNGVNSITEQATSASVANPVKLSIPSDYMLPDGTPDYVRLILTSKVYDVVNETPLSKAVGMSEKLNCKILLKREDLQPVFSFKLRGAYNKIANLPEDERWKGVIACSAGNYIYIYYLFIYFFLVNLLTCKGNHAQGVAYSARHLNIPSTIVMPTGTASIKYNNVARMGSKVILYGDDFDEAKKHCNKLSELHGLQNIPPFDDPYVIAGQGTIALEILRQTDLSNLQAIFVSIGGGGLISGIASYVKRIAPHVKIIGVESEDACAMKQSLEKGERIELNQVGLFAEGIITYCAH